VRTLESLFWLGVKLANEATHESELFVEQWEPYEVNTNLSTDESLNSLLKYLKKNSLSHIRASTSIMIIPGYKFRIINGLITNFHQPKSTLLLLVSALIGDNWKLVYKYALANNFRFLSYGDSSIFLIE
jgi:S-adenosylmethionine:tRNA ribosyltransferase-isomerase